MRVLPSPSRSWPWLQATILSASFLLAAGNGSLVCGQDLPVEAHEDIDATLWMRTSAEYRVLCHDAFRRALEAVDAGLTQPCWSALPDQIAQLQVPGAAACQYPPAIILDVDETALDNSRYQIECIQAAPHQFVLADWNAWCERRAAPPIPGVTEFLAECRKRGVAIRFVTNRGPEVRAATIANLRKYGLTPEDDSAEAELLLKGDRPEWGSDKTVRRAFVASTHRVLALIGDDLHDFVWSGTDATPEQRLAAAGTGTEFWGRRWFLIPNASNGGWERAIEGYQTPTREEKLQRKLKALTGE